MRSELEKYGIQMPAFSKIGGILANEVYIYNKTIVVKMFLQKYNVICYWYLLTSEMYWLWKESLNSDGQQFHQYQQNEQPHLT